jgi:hypothetical protein
VSRIAASFLGLSALAVACGGGRPSGEKIEVDVEEGSSAAEADVSVHVISHAFRDAAIFLYVGDSRHRLGIATGKQTTIFTIPWRRFARASTLRLTADPIGMVNSRGSGVVDVRSDTFTVKPGNTVVWTLELQLGRFEGDEAPGQSNVTVY